MANLSLRGIQKSYTADTQIIKGLDLEVADGEFIVFVGPSGCGKSTLLRMIAGLEDITSGELRIGGELVNDVPPANRGVAMVFQSYALYPHMTVAQNMGFALKLAGTSSDKIRTAVGDVAEILQITHLLDRKPKALSGGERQRVAIGRAIVRKPKVFLFDEPLSNLDASLRVQMRIELSKLHEELGTTMIYVTHDQVEAMTLGERIAVFNKGHMEQVGAPLELYRNPDNQFVAGFLGSPKMNFVPCNATRSGSDGLTLEVSGGNALHLPSSLNTITANEEIMLGIRPEDIQFVSPDQGFKVRVDLLEHLGDSEIVYGTLVGTKSTVAIKRHGHDASLKAGSIVGIRPNTNNAMLFGKNGQTIRGH
ncbi:MAG: sn-glycerol-3-phosphate ABC transporter ATP-binding protein UgpC [Pseudomonadota bacterium]